MKQGTKDAGLPRYIRVPMLLAEPLFVARNPIRQVLIRNHSGALIVDGKHRSLRLESGEVVRLAARSPNQAPINRILIVPEAQLEGSKSIDLTDARWVGDRTQQKPTDVIASLVDAFNFLQAGTGAGEKGLRPAQIGAVHAVLGYWTTKSPEPATVVMPTGTGKTDTMLALFAVERPERLLVVVPSDALRTQIADKFESFGLLQELEVVSPKSMRPSVGQVRHGFKTAQEALSFAHLCNVIVTTPAAIYAAQPAVRKALFGSCTHLFVDEAHHVAAATWREIRDDFADKPIVQFTATPFREDGRSLGGRMIYSFPLREAQKQGYFSHINYASIRELGHLDQAIARRAVDQLRKDLRDGLDHLIMARVSRIGRIGEVLPIYQDLASDLHPVVLHSTSPAKDRKAALEAVASRQSRIVLCVNMLGEGFDLPSLKIAAIHDAHKSLGITLQFVGRFARTIGMRLGDATVVVGRPDKDFDIQLRRLYAENADWNLIIRELLEGAIDERQKMSDFEAAFGSRPEEVSIRSLLPKMSTVVYRVPEAKDWNPHGVLEIFSEDSLLTFPIAINEHDGIAWFVTENRSEVRWGELKAVEETTFDLYVLYWDRKRQLLFINSSNNDSLHEGLAKAVCGASARRIIGENVYRVMAHVNRLVPTNVGLLDVRNANRRFSMLVGADVTEGFPVAEAQTKTKTNIFAYGYEDGKRVSIGASLKGRIWSYRIAASLKHWMDWCNHVGAKLVDEGISVDEVMRNFIRPKSLEERPPYAPLAAEWPWTVFANPSEETKVEHEGSAWPLVDVELGIASHETRGPIEVSVTTKDWVLNYLLTFERGEMRFAANGPDAKVLTRHNSMSFADYLHSYGLHVFFEQDAVVIPPGILLKPDRTIPPFDKGKLEVLDWKDIDLTVESQGLHQRQDSIQARVIDLIRSKADWNVIIDDDGTGEIADIVAMRSDGKTLYVHLTHCKYVAGGKPRAQVADLYEVCGQAQKSAQWRRNVYALFEYALRREKKRIELTGKTGFMKGDASSLYDLEDSSRLLRPEFTIAVAQPGLSRAAVSVAQLELLASTEVYLHETANSRFEVYCSS
jgi:superfamily II DNA or RNA helicase